MIRRLLLAFWICIPPAWALDVCLPTANDALLRPGGDAAFFQPTIEGTTESGMFGCVRRDGRRFHEGLDIRCLQRDRQGEPIDPVMVVADGTVAFINTKPGLSNYGRYVIVEHRWDGVPVYTLYAHLREVADGIAVGQAVRKGQRIATMGRSTNTREGISADRAHVHFEINFLLNPNFRIWYPHRDPKAPPFGNFNGKNLMGLNAADFFRAYAANPKLNFLAYLSQQPVAFTVLVRADKLPWSQLHPELIVGGKLAPFYELGVTSWGMPVSMWPRASADRRVPGIRSVNEALLNADTCRHLVTQAGKGWRFTTAGEEWLEIMTFTP